jgi:hypothetical protein
MGRQAPDGLIGIHTNLLTPALANAEALCGSPPSAGGTCALDALAAFHATGAGYFVGGGAAADDRLRPAGFTRRPGGMDARPRHGQLPEDRPRFCHGQPSTISPGAHIVDNVTLYWLTGTGASAARSYWEEGQETARAAGQAPRRSRSGGFTAFPGDLANPARWVEKPTQHHLLQRVDKAATSPPGKSRNSSGRLRAAFGSLR